MPASFTDDLRLAHLLADDADATSSSRFQALDLRVETKPDLTPVSDADRAVEEGVRRTLARARPRDTVLGEEMGEHGGLHGRGARRWIVDPIDGTKNFVRGVPVWATLIALTVEDEVVVGVVSAPALHRRWWAVKGGGAWTGRSLQKAAPCRVSDVSRLEDASLSYSSLDGWQERGRLEDFLALARQCWRTRAYGDFWSYMLVAEGAVDLAAEPELALHDMAALDVIVREAGGRFTSLAGHDGPYGGNALATNGMLHDVALGFLGAVDHDPEEPVEPTAEATAQPVAPEGAVFDMASRRRPATWQPGSRAPDPSPGVPPLG